jgi:hypothetical protein
MKNRCFFILTLVLLLGSALAPLLTVEEAEGQVLPVLWIPTDPSTLWFDARSSENRTRNVTLTIPNPTSSYNEYNVTVNYSRTEFHVVPDSFHVIVPERGEAKVNITVSVGPKVLDKEKHLSIVAELVKTNGAPPSAPYRILGVLTLFSFDRDLHYFSSEQPVVRLRPGTEGLISLKKHHSCPVDNKFRYSLFNKEELESKDIEVQMESMLNFESNWGNQSLPARWQYKICSTNKLAEPGVHELFILANSRSSLNNSDLIRFLVIVEGVNPTVELGIIFFGLLLLFTPFFPTAKRKLGPLVASFRKQSQEDPEEQQETTIPPLPKVPDTSGGKP